MARKRQAEATDLANVKAAKVGQVNEVAVNSVVDVATFKFETFEELYRFAGLPL